MADLPTGTVTFLYTDLEGSTARWERQPQAMRAAVARHDALIRQAVETHGGRVFRTTGDGLCAAFATAPDAVAAALAAQLALHAEEWGDTGPLRARMALHTGAAELADGDYVGACLNRVGRLLATGHGGQALLSQATADLAQDALPDGAGLRPLGEQRLRDLIRPEPVYQLLHADLPADFPPPRSLDAAPHNLPVQLTSFVGRELELAQVGALLATTRLLTLTGAGGCGKTRLALQAAADRLDEYADGVWLAELAPLADPALVPQTMATALGVREQPGQPILTTLLAALETKRLLLVLDNCEHVLDAGARLADALLRGCPGVRVLATSREALTIAGERAWRVPSLATPDPDRLPPLAELSRVEAIRLFVERAGFAQPRFALTDQNAPAVARLCQRLDGIPLAIELAAARVPALTVDQIARRLDDRFRLLTGGSRTALPRQQTLRAAIDWSYGLLTPVEQAALRRLSVFAGGWALEAAEAVCVGAEVEPDEVLDLLARLVGKSLVQVEERGEEARYGLLETIRQYGRDRLLEAGDGPATRDRHRDWRLAQAERAEAALGGPDGVAWLDRLEADHDNLRAALDWSLAEPAGAAAGLRLAGASGALWVILDHVNEGLRWLEALLAVDAAAPAARAKALTAAGFLASHWDDNERAAAHLQEGLALYRSLGDRQGSAHALRVLGRVARTQGDYERATALLEEGLALARAARDTPNIGDTLFELGRMALHQGDYAGAEERLGESLALCREYDIVLRIASVQVFLGVALAGRGEPRRAAALLAAGLARARAQGFRRGVAQALQGLGRVAWVQGEAARAVALLRESLALGRDLHYREGIAECLEALAIIAGDADRDRRSASLAPSVTLLAAADALRATIGAPLPPADRPGVEATLAAAREGLGAAACAAAWAEGQALTLEEAVAEALAEEPVAG